VGAATKVAPVSVLRDPCASFLSGVLRRVEAAAAALPASPVAALRELHLIRAQLTARLNGVEPPAGADAAPAAVRLTARERQVLALLAQGDRNKEIALRLGLRERTVKFHVANLMAKLGAQSRTEALRRSLELGLLPHA
jgi:DNA-binding NarL/FixJ family response regulator